MPSTREVQFKLLPQQRMRAPAVELPTQPIETSTMFSPIQDGIVGNALEMIAGAPSFDQYSASDIAQALGSSVYAVVDNPNRDTALWVTNEDFDPDEPISVDNPPFTAGDLLPSPNSPDGTWEVIDWPTDGPTFENGSGMRIQLETDEVRSELSPDPEPDLPRVGFSSGFDDRNPTPGTNMDDQPQGSQFTNPDVLPVDSEMREMAVEFIKTDLKDQVSHTKVQRAIGEFNEMATTPGNEFDFGVQTLIENAYKQAGIPLPQYRAERFNPDDQRAIGGSAGGGRMDVRWPRGIDEQELGVVAGNMADDGYDRELYSPLNQAQLPTDPQTLIRLAEVMEDYAQTRRDVSADYDGQGWYLRVAGVIYQAAADQMDRR